jgi:hypothetical protein
MSTNYDSSQVGVPYVRANKITILYPDNGAVPSAQIEQALAVKLLDGTTREIEKLQVLNIEINLDAHGTEAIPLVNPTTGGPLGINTNLNTVMVQILAVVRKHQLEINP